MHDVFLLATFISIALSEVEVAEATGVGSHKQIMLVLDDESRKSCRRLQSHSGFKIGEAHATRSSRPAALLLGVRQHLLLLPLHLLTVRRELEAAIDTSRTYRAQYFHRSEALVRVASFARKPEAPP